MTPTFRSFGALGTGEFYVERQADRELFEELVRGEFCYVLGPRQIGKSSLRVRTERRLKQDGVRSVAIDLTRIGSSELTAEEWYFGLVEETRRRLALNVDTQGYWERERHLSPVQRWSYFLHDVVLAQVPELVVFFVDEIDTIMALPFRDEFFAAVRALYNSRPDQPELRRLTFCLLGTAAPQDLMKDTARTPFNIGRPIDLEDFTWVEMQGFLPGLAPLRGRSGLLLRTIFDWTDGHPYMTQRLCEALLQEGHDGGLDRIPQLVRDVFLERPSEDPNLAYAERHFDVAFPHPRAVQMLRVFRLLLESPIQIDQENPVHIALCLSGMATRRTIGGEKVLQVRNRIFREVFTREWIIARQSGRRFAETLDRWLDSGHQDQHLLKGEQLDEAIAWSRGRADVSADERDFILASDRGRQRDLERERRRRLILVFLGALAMVLGGVGVLSWQYVRQRERLMDAEGRLALSSSRERALQQTMLRLQQERARDEAARREMEQRIEEGQRRLERLSGQRRQLARGGQSSEPAPRGEDDGRNMKRSDPVPAPAPAPAAPLVPLPRVPGFRYLRSSETPPWEDATRRWLRAGLRTQLGEVKRCYQFGLDDDPSLSGKVRIFFSWGDAQVESVQPSGSTFKNPAVEGCVASQLRRMRLGPMPAHRVGHVYRGGALVTFDMDAGRVALDSQIVLAVEE